MKKENRFGFIGPKAREFYNSPQMLLIETIGLGVFVFILYLGSLDVIPVDEKDLKIAIKVSQFMTLYGVIHYIRAFWPLLFKNV